MIVVINAQTLGVSEYGLDWSDLVVRGDGVVCGLGGAGDEAGLWALDDAAGELVAPVVETGELSFGASTPKTALRAYVTAQGGGDLRLEVKATGPSVGGGRTVAYQLAGRALDAPVERAMKLGRGVEGQRLGVRLEPTPGEPWRLDGLALRVQPRARNR